MKVENHASKDFLSDDGRTGVSVEKLDDAVVHITIARKGMSGAVELTETQLAQLAELIPAAAEHVRGLREVKAEGWVTEKNAYQILAELYDYVADPKRTILNSTDREHIAVALRTMLVLYQDDLDAKTTPNPSKNLEEARRPVRSSQDKRNWIERQMGKFLG